MDVNKVVKFMPWPIILIYIKTISYMNVSSILIYNRALMSFIKYEQVRFISRTPEAHLTCYHVLIIIIEKPLNCMFREVRKLIMICFEL